MNIQELKQTAQDRLSAASYDPRKLSALYAGASVAVSLALTVVNFLLTRQMDTTSGLSGITTRAILSFAQAMLSIAATVAMPFWEFGFYRSALNISRNEPAKPATLLSGFRRFGPVLRLLLLRTALVTGILFGCLQAATLLFMMTPWSDLTMLTAEQLLQTGTEMDAGAIGEMMQTLFPLYIILAALVGVLLMPILYRFRLSDWAVMDGTDKARQAMGLSAYWMHRRRLWLFRLDLSFWWYYGLMGVASLVAYGDYLLPLLGIAMNKDAAFFLFYLLSGAVHLFVAWRFAPQVHTTYALAYDGLRAEKELKIEN